MRKTKSESRTRELHRLPPPFEALDAALRQRAGALVSKGLSDFYRLGRPGVVAVNGALEPVGYLSVAGARTIFPNFTQLAREATHYLPTGETLVLCRWRELAVLVKLVAIADETHLFLLGGGASDGVRRLVLSASRSGGTVPPAGGSRTRSCLATALAAAAAR